MRSRKLNANVFRTNPTPAIAERSGCNFDADGIIGFGAVRRFYGSCTAHGDNRMRAGFGENRMRHNLIRLVVITGCIFDETKAAVPNEHIGIRVDRLQENTLSDRRLTDVGTLRLRRNRKQNRHQHRNKNERPPRSHRISFARQVRAPFRLAVEPKRMRAKVPGARVERLAT